MRKSLMKVVLALVFVCASTVAYAQNFSGNVYDSQGPLPGVTVMEKGTTNGVITDLNGNFTISAKAGSTLVFSFMGYENQEVPAAANMKVNLEESSLAINEVVVIGYGTQRREAVTGSVANIGGEKLNEVAAPNIAYALAGRMPGVVMTQTSTKPGADMQIRIRGQRSLSASNDPLIVLDGIPFNGNLSDISTENIKSMDILKDASATAIYGSRGANGVIMITTIKGQQGAPAKVSYNGYAGFKNVFHKYPMMDGPEYVKFRKYAGMYINSVDESDDINTDWQDLFYRQGFTTSHDVNVTGGTNGGSYSFAAGYYKDQAVVPTQNYERISVRGNIDQAVGKYFRFGLSTNTNYNITRGNQIGLYQILEMSPIANPYDENGNFKRTVKMPNDEIWITPRSVIEANADSWLNNTKGLGTYNTFFGEVKCPWIEGLSYRINVGLNYRTSKNGSFTGTGINATDSNNANSASVSQNVSTNWAVENLVTYDRFFGKHHINVVGLYSAERETYESIGMSGRAIPAEYFQYYNIGAATKDLTVNPNAQSYWESGLSSWMGRAMYDYDNRYMISATVRADASSRLAKGHQWHTYPAVSLGWNIANESFMSDVKWIDKLKLRVGYGETSNQAISPYSTLGSLATRTYNFGDTYETGYYVSKLPNEELGWEYSKTWNFGIDYSFLNGRLNGSLEYYIQNTEDILLGVSMPATSGVSSYTANIGSTRNQGMEFTVNGVIVDNKNGWNWNAGLNFYFNRNKLTSLASGADRDEANGWFVGYPIDVIYDYEYIGLWQKGEEELMAIQEPGGNLGMIKVKGGYDEDGNPRQIGPEDRQIISMEPALQGGFNTDVTWKGFDLSLIASFQIGGKLISSIHSGNGYLNMLTGRRGQISVDYWTEENPDAKYPKPGGILSGDNPKYASTLGVFDASYLKVRTITLGYSFENLKGFEASGISKLRVYATVQNPFVIFSPYTNECGLDPETNTYSNDGGTSAVAYGGHRMPIIGYNTPSTRNFIFGVNLTF